MTVIAIVTDAIYLEEPFVYDVTWVNDTHQQLPAPPVSTIIDAIPGHSKRFVPHFLPDQNPALSDLCLSGPERRIHHETPSSTRAGCRMCIAAKRLT